VAKRHRRYRSDRWQATVVAGALGLALCCLTVSRARADEGGVSFWLPGSFGSLAATPQSPGWSFATTYYHTSVTAGGNVAASRQITIGRLRPTVNISLNVDLESHVDLVFPSLTYVFESPVLGGQLALGMTSLVGHNFTSLDGTLTASVGTLVVTREGTLDSSLGGFGDLFPQVSLRWNRGVHNYLTYVKGGIPVGAYDATRLANLGIGHGALDGGGGYTYFDPTTGHEFSAVAGLTYNFENPDTEYRNGVNLHLDWGASQFLSKRLYVGLVGYLYQQLSADSGASPILGDFRSRVAAVGPQIGSVFPVGKLQGYVNVKGYWEFAAKNRPEGWNLWMTVAISPPPPAPPPARMRQ
jgi:hypothetical protein